MEEVAHLYRAVPHALRFFGVIDVAGNEHAVPNWVFVALAEELRHRINPAQSLGFPSGASLTFTVHAGEGFDTPLQGLRRIWEVLRYMPTGTRIGHGLALGWQSYAQRARRREEQVAQELLDDLVWAWYWTADQNIKSELERSVRSLLQELRLPMWSTDALWDAYEDRFSLDALTRLGVLNMGADGENGWRHYHGIIDRSVQRSGSVKEQISAFYIISSDSSLRKRSVNLSRWRDISDRSYFALHPLVNDLMNQRGSVVEACPTSNLIVGEISDYSRHPIFDWVKAGDRFLSTTINTDDPGVFHTNIEDEYSHIWLAGIERGMRPTDMADMLETIRQCGMETFCWNLSRVGLSTVLEESIEALEVYARR
jgi:hypothetical protein